MIFNTFENVLLLNLKKPYHLYKISKNLEHNKLPELKR
jgi:hypothetical protein